jgi:hypothetical protein
MQFSTSFYFIFLGWGTKFHTHAEQVSSVLLAPTQSTWYAFHEKQHKIQPCSLKKKDNVRYVANYKCNQL